MPPDDDARLRHLIEAAETAMQFVEGRSRSDLDDDEMLRLALTKLVEIVGEAAKQVTGATRQDHPTVPWSAAARMRDRLVHHYFDIDLDVLWSTVMIDLPALLAVIPRPPTTTA
ncbi:MAG TPA: HepT-like ribonuclease domain-containing protein [Acidimicrobiales bacterium]|nr:HepT-like ribonuclease domain-containing protein [Acidimicrobiales bacterium]